MAARRFRWQAVKTHRNYTVDEAAKAIGASRATLRRWLASGALPAIKDRKPYLILGSDLRDFLAARAKPKTHCPPGTCYCVKCRDVRKPDGGIADFIPLSAGSGNLRGLCPACGTLMHRRTSRRQLEAISAFLEVSIVERPPRIGDRATPCPNEHIE